MKAFLTDKDSLPFVKQYLKSQLRERYGDSILVLEGDVDPLFFCFPGKTANETELRMEGVMSYELSPFLPALFEARNIFQKADKPQLFCATILCYH